MSQISDDAAELLHMLSDTADGFRYQSCHGKTRQAAAHELERAGLATWKGNSYGTNFYCITDAGRAALSSAYRKDEQ